MRHDLDEPALLLERHDSSHLAAGVLEGLQNTEARERSSIFSAAADALDIYNSTAALQVARDQNFHPSRFVRTGDTIYIHAPGEDQAGAAPLVCGLLSDIRRATYQAHRENALTARVLFALDEVANIAPLDELPGIASEGGSQGLTLLASLQDLSQARARWGTQADGFLTLFASKLLLRGIADKETLETVSIALGEYDRRIVSRTSTQWFSRSGPQQTQTISTQRTRVLSPGEVAKIPHGKALHIAGGGWSLIDPTPAHSHLIWQKLAALPIAATDAPS
jgi:type IV secretory pathway TraG/TraD family ATPase VirD4